MPKINRDLIHHFMCLTLDIDNVENIEKRYCPLPHVFGAKGMRCSCMKSCNCGKDAIVRNMLSIWAMWQQDTFPNTQSYDLKVTLCVLASRSMCQGCIEGDRHHELVNKWLGLLKSTPCPENMKDRTGIIFPRQILKETEKKKVIPVRGMFALPEIVVSNDQAFLQDLRKRLETSKDDNFMGKVFGLVEELKWVKARQSPLEGPKSVEATRSTALVKIQA